MKDRILIVDDVEINRMMLDAILSEEYDITEAADGQEAIAQLRDLESSALPTAILLDIMMPIIDGFGVMAYLKSTPRLVNIPVIVITAAEDKETETKFLSEGAVDFIHKPFEPEIVKVRVINAIKLYKYQTQLEGMVEQKTRELVEKNEKMLETLATIIEYRSLESGEHIRRTCELTRIISTHMLTRPLFARELIEQDYNAIVKASALHDIGKVGIPDNILLKPGRLTAEEYEIIKTHSVIGWSIIDSIKFESDDLYIKHCKDICRHHHERWDGTGYPDGLSGTDIPLSARIVAIVDVYDALVSTRCYKPGFTLEKTYEILSSSSGTQFQPEIVECLFEVKEELYELEQSMKEPEFGKVES